MLDTKIGYDPDKSDRPMSSKPAASERQPSTLGTEDEAAGRARECYPGARCWPNSLKMAERGSPES
jgi:hypothetical protein